MKTIENNNKDLARLMILGKGIEINKVESISDKIIYVYCLNDIYIFNFASNEMRYIKVRNNYEKENDKKITVF